MKFKCPKCDKIFPYELECCETENINCPKCNKKIIISSKRTTTKGA